MLTGPLRVVPSSTGLPSKRCPGIRFLSRTDREIGVFWHLAPPTSYLEFPRETCLILRCAGKVRNPVQTKQGYRSSCSDQEGRRGSDEVVSGTSVFPSSDTSMSGNFGGCIKCAKYRVELQGRTRDFTLDAVVGKGFIFR